ncbi:type II secretion system protein [Pseudomonadota bacterium]
MKNTRGFTLIELTLLVIIAGIVLGIFFNLKNKEEVSEIKSIIIQVEHYNSMVHLFKEKYGELPGDIARTKILELSEHNTNGNENGLLEDDKNSINKASGEIVNFWYHLSSSGFLEQKFDGKSNEEAKIGLTFPTLPFNKDIGITVFGFGGQNYYQIGVFEATKNNIIMSDKTLKPKIAFGIDKKVDDGLAKTGDIIAVNGKFVNGYRELNSNCIDFNDYNLRYKELSCQLRIKFPKENESD